MIIFLIGEDAAAAEFLLYKTFCAEERRKKRKPPIKESVFNFCS